MYSPESIHCTPPGPFFVVLSLLLALWNRGGSLTVSAHPPAASINGFCIGRLGGLARRSTRSEKHFEKSPDEF